ncbi:MAG TPA: MerR family transcriptional regulator [Feifaniaceae bacterium]|nr:MerR family transcriptional regulator [Feifaniaceae bacterium]
MQYRISEVAQLLGITTAALHFFEKEKIIVVKKRDNGYRYYDTGDLFRLLSYEKYRSMGYPLKSVLCQFEYETDNRREILERMQQQQAHAFQMAAYYRGIADAMEEHLRGIRAIDALLGRYELARSPDMLFLYDRALGWISRDRSMQAAMQEWVKAMPYTRISFAVHQDAAQAGKGQPGTLGYAMRREHAGQKGLPLEKARALPAADCLHTILATDDSFLEDPSVVFEGLLREARGRGLTCAGSPWGTVLLVEIRPDKGLRPYLELWLPVKL